MGLFSRKKPSKKSPAKASPVKEKPVSKEKKTVKEIKSKKLLTAEGWKRKISGSK